MKSLSTILHPTDFSANAKHALELACGLARDRGARLIVLHVSPPLPPQWTGSELSLLSFHEGRWEAATKLRRMNCRTLQPERLLRTGKPAPVIVSVAKEVDADLIVIGQPQPSRWRWLVEERVAQSVARTATCPVLVATSPKVHPGQVAKLHGGSLNGRHDHGPMSQVKRLA
jgi:nucleotide-binding universal stress UspA family protein